MRRPKSPNPVVVLVREFLARPDIKQALEDARRAARCEALYARRRGNHRGRAAHLADDTVLDEVEHRRVDAALAGLLSERYRVRTGTWTADEVEPYLASPRSSLDMRGLPNYSDLGGDE